ncbi:hypothetical protein [Noviherbaspirillum malthae]|uniref:hypothetical protein n=1 Tax=Noviherbaspirillum malthae TaxID=1260987 RepID=UPI0018900827|nr:hypothetical protein [Noviherbaspirillum malthae]
MSTDGVIAAVVRLQCPEVDRQSPQDALQWLEVDLVLEVAEMPDSFSNPFIYGQRAAPRRAGA